MRIHAGPDASRASWFHEAFGKSLDQHVVSQAQYVGSLGRLVLLAAQNESMVFVGRGAQFFLPREAGFAVRNIATPEDLDASHAPAEPAGLRFLGYVGMIDPLRPGAREAVAACHRAGVDEMWRSFSKRAFVRAAQRLVPDVQPHHFEWAPAGVRAQAVSRDGQMVDDFVIAETDRVINIENAPSPAATASLNIGRLVVERLAQRA